MGQCLSRSSELRYGKKHSEQSVVCPKQDKNIDDKRMFKLGIDVLNRDFCIQIGYNRKAVKTYGKGPPNGAPKAEGDANLEEVPVDKEVVS